MNRILLILGVIGAVMFGASKSVLDRSVKEMGAKPPDLWTKWYGAVEVAAFKAEVAAKPHAAKWYAAGRSADWFFPAGYWLMLTSVVLVVCRWRRWRLAFLVALPTLAMVVDYTENMSLVFGDGAVAGKLTVVKFGLVGTSFVSTAALLLAGLATFVYQRLRA